MPVDDLYVLPENVQLIAVTEVAEQARSKFEYKDEDFVITYTNGRSTSKIIDAASAMLLREFKKPTSMIEGIFKYSFLNKLDPQETLEEAYPFLARLRHEGFLILHNAAASKINNDLLQPGAPFKAYEVVEKIQGLTDTEVYKLKNEMAFFVLKVLKTGGKQSLLAQQFYNERALLKQLRESHISPEIIESGALEDNLYLVMEYCSGTPCDAATEAYRNLGDPDNVVKLLAVAVNILNAYETLHAQGVVHSDIHPRNIIVAENGDVKLIDFGLAQQAGLHDAVPRGGISFFYEPEYAVAIRDGQPAPAATFAGEQYALATLLYFLFTGKQYLNFSYERDVLLQQISNDAPLPFRTHDIDIDPEIETVLFKALSKNPAGRYASVTAFKTCMQHILERCRAATPATKYSAAAFCKSIKYRFGFDGPFIENGLGVSPASSVNYGAAGIAYMFYRMALIEQNAELLSVADVWINRAYGYLKNMEAALYATDIEITPATVGDVSIYHSASGVHLVQALISKAMGNESIYRQCVLQFIESASKPCDNLDLTVGKSSVLIGCALLQESNDDENEVLQKELQHFGTTVLNDIWNVVSDFGPIHKTNPLNYNGMAHGWAGVLYATLRWCMQSGAALPDAFMPRVQQLQNTAIHEGDYIRWPLTVENTSSWPGWCHGSAGHVFLWSTLYRFLGDHVYLELAEKTARHFISDESSNGSLCCGLAGKCYALLNLYNTTKAGFYLTEIKKEIKTLLRNAYSPEMRNNSLYKGDIGMAVLLTEAGQPQHARMPLFE